MRSVNSNPGLKLASGALGSVARTLFALPDGLMRRIFGDPPPEAAGLCPDSWAMARITAPAENRRTSYDPAEVRKETEFLAGAVSLPVAGVKAQDWKLEGTDAAWLPGSSHQRRIRSPARCSSTSTAVAGFRDRSNPITEPAPGSPVKPASGCSRSSTGWPRKIPFPAQADDALLAWRAVMDDPARFGADPARVGVSGDSAGAQMATVLCLDLKAAGEPQPACQVLIYPVTDCAGSMASRDTFAFGFYLTRARMDWFEECFVPEGEELNPRVSPLYAEDLSGLAPAWSRSRLPIRFGTRVRPTREACRSRGGR